ncbi:MAG: tRNA guanosine(34) transglycosylase Tgt [Candidatus Woesearchaeota archaeon]|nr:MAG: tRNA guanosine(34) transglycosylase Tgt [Candidatus Woesearchaeota archaeon]
MATILARSGKARVLEFVSRSGVMQTPFFMAVATRATGKIITSDDYNANAQQAIICNALVTYLRPGLEAIKKAGGLHKFMNFHGLIATDSGGFQMSRGFFEKSSKNALHFRSPYDQSLHVITPEKMMDIEMTLGSDIAMALDVMMPYGSSEADFKKALDITLAWHQRAKKAHTDAKQLLFGIVQGGFSDELRAFAAKAINEMDFPGNAVGGLAIGEPSSEMFQALRISLPLLDEHKPRYVMGLGSPPDVLEAISLGADMFDSIYPTKSGRHHKLFTFAGPLTIDQGKYRLDFSPLEEGCDCLVCQKYTKAYVYHLSKIGDPVGKRFEQIHNLRFMQRLMDRSREEIKTNTFEAFKTAFQKNWGWK